MGTRDNPFHTDNRKIFTNAFGNFMDIKDQQMHVSFGTMNHGSHCSELANGVLPELVLQRYSLLVIWLLLVDIIFENICDHMSIAMFRSECWCVRQRTQRIESGIGQ